MDTRTASRTEVARGRIALNVAGRDLAGAPTRAPRLALTIAVCGALLCPWALQAQEIREVSGRLAARVVDEEIRDSAGRTLYRWMPNGEMRNAQGQVVLRLRNDEIRDRQHRLIGRFVTDTLRDDAGRLLGRIDTTEVRDHAGRTLLRLEGVSPRLGAVYFFFLR